jgi:hypothetical protein
MARGHGRLKPLQIERFKGPGKLSDGGGLGLIAVAQCGSMAKAAGAPPRCHPWSAKR